jgi:hypothetical protein
MASFVTMRIERGRRAGAGGSAPLAPSRELARR